MSSVDDMVPTPASQSRQSARPSRHYRLKRLIWLLIVTTVVFGRPSCSTSADGRPRTEGESEVHAVLPVDIKAKPTPLSVLTK